MLPTEDKFDESSVLERSHDLPDVDVRHVGALVRLGSEILVDDDDSLLQQVSVNSLLFSLRDLDHWW